MMDYKDLVEGLEIEVYVFQDESKSAPLVWKPAKVRISDLGGAAPKYAEIGYKESVYLFEHRMDSVRAIS